MSLLTDRPQLPAPSRVAICREEPRYPTAVPYGPDEAYPELGALAADAGGPPNSAYRAVRGALRLLGCDADRFGSPSWNPLGAWIRPGDRVLVKPNWVMHRHPEQERLGLDVARDCLVTHPSVLRAVLDYVQLALRGEGRIVLADAPLQGCDFDALLRRSHVPELVDHFARMRRDGAGSPSPVPVEVDDLRLEVAVERASLGGVGATFRKELRDETRAHAIVDLDEWSALEPISAGSRAFRVTGYDPQGMARTHRPGHHAYCVSRHVLEADAIVNVPKLKTHKKGGITVALKNLVGINAQKNWLPHHTEGTPDRGGDQFPAATTKARLEHSWMGTAKRWLKNRPGLSRVFVPVKKLGRLFFGDTQHVVRSGNWHGNDTCWRMVLDLNKCFFFYDGAGERRRHPVRYLAVVDGIIGGEGNGPMSPDPKPCGVVVAGTHPTAVDLVAATLMGFDWRKLRLLRHSFALRELSFVPFQPGDIQIVSDKAEWTARLEGMSATFGFRPHFGWRGAIERTAPDEGAGRAPQPGGARC